MKPAHLLFASLALSCGAPSTPKPSAPPPATETASEAPSSAASAQNNSYTSSMGLRFELPPQWHLEERDGYFVVQDPERELKVWLVDVKAESDEEAIRAAWKLAVPDFAREVDDSVSPPDSEGWDSVTQIGYKVAAEESRVVLGVARRKSGVAYVILLDAPVQALQRRGAQLGQFLEGQKAPGVEEESFAGKKARAFDDTMANTLDAFLEEARQKTGVPGAAIAIVQGGKVVFERGYGSRGGKKGEKVTPDTRFMIGSTTKSLTSLMMGVLVERGLFAWTSPMAEVFPRFKLKDEAITKQVQMQHSVCACTGLPRQDFEFIFEFSDLSPEKRLDELAAMKPTTGFGETFQYSNTMVAAGGYAAAHAFDPKTPLFDAYVRAMKSAVFEPIGMPSTTFSSKEAKRGKHALPHGAYIDGSYGELPLSYEDAVISVAPAGGAWSTVQDLAKYVQVELAANRPVDGKAVVPAAALLERRKPRVKIGDKSAYGLGLMLSTDADLGTIGHGGNTLGFTTLLNLWPEHDLGLVILSNAQGANTFTGLVQRRLLELVFDDVQPKAETNLAFYVQRHAESVAQSQERIDADAGAWLKGFAGRYHNDALGSLVIRKKKDGYWADVGEWQSRLAKYSDAGQSTILFAGPPVAGLQLQPQDDGSLLLDAGQQRYLFKPAGKR